MFQSYLDVALRGLLRNRIHSAINVFGLALGTVNFQTVKAAMRDQVEALNCE